MHERVIALVREALLRTEPFEHALDVGCGAGLSTAALAGVAVRRTGLDPVEAMAALAPGVAPGAQFLSAAAEAMPFRSGSFDCLTAAGSLNYADLARFFPEAVRVMRPDGVLVVYDFSAARTFADGSTGLDRWFEAFVTRYPYPHGDAIALDPQILAAMPTGLRIAAASEFAIPLELTAEFYLAYMMTETNISRCADAAEARAWCAETLAPVWEGRSSAAVLFRGYFVCLAA